MTDTTSCISLLPTPFAAYSAYLRFSFPLKKEETVQEPSEQPHIHHAAKHDGQ
jgi:hypothetical protein